MSSGDKALDAVIDYEVSLFDRTEIAGAYRSICAMLLLRTANVVLRPARTRNMEAQQKKTAREWLQGNRGIITFEEACQAIDVDPSSMRRQMLDRVREHQYLPKKRPFPSHVFGRQSDEHCTEVAAVG